MTASRRAAHAVTAGLAAAACWAAAEELGSRKPVRASALLLVAVTAMAATITRSSQQASDKAYAVQQQLNNFFTNGGTINGMLNAAGGLSVSGNTLTLGHGNPSPGTTGGWPASYDPSYGSQMSADCQSAWNKLASSGIF
jgi:hypothetical protein